MSIKECIDRAAALGGWMVVQYMGRDYIRRDLKGRICPLSALAGLECHEFLNAGNSLGLSIATSQLIARSADFDGGRKEAHIRRYMLRKFGLTEVTNG